MQKFTYFELKVVLIPLSVISGILYLFYRYPQGNQIDALNIDSLEIIAIVHTVAAFSLVAFLIVHIYLITTGETITSNLRAMMTGYEELEDEDADEYEEEIEENSQENEEKK